MISPISREKARSLARSFKCAGRGVAFCVKNERNMRIHLTVAAYVLVFSAFYEFSAAQYALLILVICSVISTEGVNTAIEAVVNMGAPHYDSLARIAKDAAAGAVLVCAAGAAIIGCIFYIRLAVLVRIFAFFAGSPLMTAVFVVSLAAAAVFIRWPRRTGKIRIKKN